MALIEEEKVFVRGIRANILKIMRSALRMYEKTGDEKFLAHAKHFGDFSAKLKGRL